ncbi:hypothetical protein BBP40_002134 [Aspergillus hancockii]|nr:hypothetical protein BBP40_002134 [Aspergillus hancockii]
MPLYLSPNMHDNVLCQFSLKGKIAAVTGGARGIGLEVVRGLAEAGAHVALIYASSADAPKTAAKVATETGARVKAYQSDVTSRETIAATINQVAEEFGHGRLDVVVANAGVCGWEHFFKRQGKGNLIITASVSSILVNIPQTQVAYNASKAAAVHLAKSLAVEWAEFARVNCISPGFIMTKMLTQQPKELMDRWLSMMPARRIGDPVELKGAYVFLASGACCYMTGANIVIDGGYTLP